MLMSKNEGFESVKFRPDAKKYLSFSHFEDTLNVFVMRLEVAYFDGYLYKGYDIQIRKNICSVLGLRSTTSSNGSRSRSFPLL